MTKNPNEDEWIVGVDYNNKRIDYFLKKKIALSKLSNNL